MQYKLDSIRQPTRTGLGAFPARNRQHYFRSAFLGSCAAPLFISSSHPFALFARCLAASPCLLVVAVAVAHDVGMGNFDEPEYGQTPYEDRQALMGEITGSQEDIARIRPGSKVFLLLVFLVPASAGLLFGYDIGGTSNAFLTGFDGHNMQQTFNFSDTVKQAVVSFSLVGAIFGSLCCFGVGDYLSRRGVVMMAGGFYAGGALITGSAVNLGFLLTGRFIYGLGIGFAMHSAPLYIAEIAPPHLRGISHRRHSPAAAAAAAAAACHPPIPRRE